MSVDTAKQEIQLLLLQFDKGSVVLFAGAGFSVGAKNGFGKDPPLSSDLSQILASDCGWTHDAEELAEVYGQAEKHLGTSALNALLASYYKDCRPADWHYLISSKLFWYRIYTTNIDDVLENAYSKGACQKLRQ